MQTSILECHDVAANSRYRHPTLGDCQAPVEGNLRQWSDVDSGQEPSFITTALLSVKNS